MENARMDENSPSENMAQRRVIATRRLMGLTFTTGILLVPIGAATAVLSAVVGTILFGIGDQRLRPFLFLQMALYLAGSINR